MQNLTELMMREDYPALARALRDFMFEEWNISGKDLERDPKHCLEIAHIGFREIPTPDNFLDGQCEFGRYDDMKAEIILFPASMSQRNTFTLVHEFAHHIQACWDKWNEALVDTGRKPEITQNINEHAANSFAGLIVAYSGDSQPDGSDLAGWMVQTYLEQTACSKQAMLFTTAETISKSLMLVLVEDNGRILASKSHGDRLAPAPSESIQPEIGKLAIASRHSGHTETGTVSIVYRSNSVRDSLRAQVCAIPDDHYAFAVISEINKSGRESWSYEEHDCSNPACNQHFTVTRNIQKCNNCGSPKCPECGRCDCDLDRVSAICPKCYMEYSSAEQIDPTLHHCLF